MFPFMFPVILSLDLLLTSACLRLCKLNQDLIGSNTCPLAVVLFQPSGIRNEDRVEHET